MRGLPLTAFLDKKLLLSERKFEHKVRRKFRARPNFYMLSDDSKLILKNFGCSLLSGRGFVAESNHRYLQWNL